MTHISTYRRVMDVNFFGHLEMIKFFLPLIKNSKGRIINMASVVSFFVSENISAYGASKAAFLQFTNALRNELYFSGISVIAICPGFMNTPLLGDKLISHLREGGDGLVEGWDMYKEAIVELTVLLSENPQKVVDVYMNALFSEFPKSLYVVGITGKLLYFLSFFPYWASDLVFYIFFQIWILARGRTTKKQA
eukprot:TRINITY_DN11037_c0_g1_i4.p1 TRINITY_DN11037_c0_g1~~TRINITY_DN11037_c0_g1_i4.p1  ORF type:complete len:193 (+),score=29.53 TRINITY_DN11037_c0_g1_i4:820-1398(+)